MRKLQLHCRDFCLPSSGREFREAFQQFVAPEDDSGFERCLGQDVLVVRELTLPTAGDELVPLARANQQACLRLVEGIGSSRLSSRDMAILYGAYRNGNAITRQRLLEAPLLFLKSFKESLASPPSSSAPEENLRADIEVLGSVARRAHRRLRQGALQNLLEREREELARSLRQSLEETRCMGERFEQELGHVGPEHANGDSQAA